MLKTRKTAYKLNMIPGFKIYLKNIQHQLKYKKNKKPRTKSMLLKLTLDISTNAGIHRINKLNKLIIQI